MATPQFNIKTGADSSAYFSREITKSDRKPNGEAYSEAELGLIKSEQFTDSDYYNYPVLLRRTGDSLKGSTESIESNELRKGRTKSAPRKGNSSSEGSLDFEFSPETYDDVLEAALRSEWEPWKNDTNSDTNIDGDYGVFQDGFFSMKSIDNNGNVIDIKKKLVGTKADCTGLEISDPNYPVVITDEKDNLEIAELTCGTKDIRYDVLKHFGGVEGDDLYQDFEHFSVNALDMSVTPGQIVTGSFSFMGSNNPELVQEGSGDKTLYTYTKATSYDSSTTYYSDEKGTVAAPQPTSEGDITGGNYFIRTENGKSEPTGIIKILSDYTGHKGRFLEPKDSEKVSDWIKNLPKKGTSTDQYTAREGFLYIDGMRVQYGSNLSFSLNNGLERTFAIFEKDAIAMSPLSLDITGSLGAYLIKGYSEKLYNLATKDTDVEVLFCFQNKEENPDTMYVVQIFKTKFTDNEISSGSENLEVTFPFQSFEERAIRIFRIRRKQPIYISALTAAQTEFDIQLSSAVDTLPADTKVNVSIGTGDAEAATFVQDLNDKGVIKCTAKTAPASGDKVMVSVTFNNLTKSRVYSVA